MIECKLLFVDDDEMIRRVMERGLSSQITSVTSVSSPDEARQALEKDRFDVVVTDLRMNGVSAENDAVGINLIRVIRERTPETEVIMQTGFGSLENVEKALRAGAYDYLEKPYKPERLIRMIERAMESRRMRSELASLRQQVAFEYGFDGLVGVSHSMQVIKEKITRAADCDMPALIAGESGVGKAHLARTIHHHSRRRRNALITFDCSATAERLMESELFGARETRPGRSARKLQGWFQHADGGTLLIKHIEKLPLTAQARLLTLLDNAGATAVEDGAAVPVDVRLIATTTVDLQEAVREGSFMGQLLDRFAGLTLTPPPLRERRDDIADLANVFLRRQNTDKGIMKLAAPTLEKLMEHEWPGNVAELQNTIRRAVALAQDKVITADDIFFTTEGKGRQSRQVAASDVTVGTRGSLEMTYRARILKSLEDNNWNFSQTAQELGIGRTTLWRKVKKYNLKRELVADK